MILFYRFFLLIFFVLWVIIYLFPLFVMSFSFWSIFKRVDLKSCLVNPIFVLSQDCFCPILFPPLWIGNICFFACFIIFLLKSGHFDCYNVQAIKNNNNKSLSKSFCIGPALCLLSTLFLAVYNFVLVCTSSLPWA